MVDAKEKTRLEIELLKQEVIKDLEAFRGEFQGMTESLAAAKKVTQENNAKLGRDKKSTHTRAHRHFYLKHRFSRSILGLLEAHTRTDRHRS